MALSPHQLIDQWKEKIPALRAEVEALRAQLQDLREVIFEDILLRRPKYVLSVQLPLRLSSRRLSPQGRQPGVDGRAQAGREEACMSTSALPLAVGRCDLLISGLHFPVGTQHAGLSHL